MLWFLPSQALEDLLDVAEGMVVENCKVALEKWMA
jgi:hypothetical protein